MIEIFFNFEASRKLRIFHEHRKYKEQNLHVNIIAKQIHLISIFLSSFSSNFRTNIGKEWKTFSILSNSGGWSVFQLKITQCQ